MKIWRKIYWDILWKIRKRTIWLKKWSVPQNYRRKIRQLSQSNEKIKVVFLVSQSQKWNGNSLYHMLKADSRFSPVVLYAPRYEHTNLDLDAGAEYRFFVERGYHCAVISSGAELRSHKPDIVFYQQPWGFLFGDLDPIYVSQYALCLYFPYSIATSIGVSRVWGICSLFFKTLYCQFVYNTAVVEQFRAKGVFNTIATGHPKMDAYREPVKTNPWKNKEGFKIVYAPHHSFEKSLLKWGTFGWNGRELLEWAKAHPETEWIFKPHPQFHFSIINESNIMNESELDEYYAGWNTVGAIYTQGDYFDIFRTADLLITDCGSFLTEWLPTEKPCIHLLSAKEIPNSRSFVHEKSSRHYYKIKNLEELYATLEMLVVRREDPLAAARIRDAKKIPMDSAKNIHQWLVEMLWGEIDKTTGIMIYDNNHEKIVAP